MARSIQPRAAAPAAVQIVPNPGDIVPSFTTVSVVSVDALKTHLNQKLGPNPGNLNSIFTKLIGNGEEDFGKEDFILGVNRGGGTNHCAIIFFNKEGKMIFGDSNVVNSLENEASAAYNPTMFEFFSGLQDQQGSAFILNDVHAAGMSKEHFDIND